ncbi:MAG: hypothetical protein O9301_08725 [Leptospira sp.]|nr:hypothetical protein [Leptospira sp.]
MKVLIYIFGKKSQLGVICFLICLSLFFTACSRQKDDKLPLLLLGLYSNPNATQTCETNPERCELSTFTSAAAPSSKTWAAVTFGGNQFVSVAQDAALTNSVMTSPDAKTWTERTAGDSEQWLGVAYGNNIFVALANSGTTNRAMTSTDGINWTARTPLSTGQYRGVAYGNGAFVLVSISGSASNQVQYATWAIR